MNVLLTGSTGFIGRALVKELSNTYNLYTASSSSTDATNHTQIDFREKNFSTRLPTKIDCVIHLIQSKHYGKDESNNNELFEINIDGTFRLLEWSRRNGIKRFILASSGNVYSWGKEPLSEKSDLNPDSFYGATKLCMEQLAKQYSNSFEVVSLRLFTVYGPGQKSMLVPNLVDRLLKGLEISVQGGTGPTFSPLYIDDCVEFFKQAIKVSLPSRWCALNVSGMEILSIKDMAEILAHAYGRTTQYTESVGEPLCFASNSKLAHRTLGYTPMVSFKEGAMNYLKNESL